MFYKLSKFMTVLLSITFLFSACAVVRRRVNHPQSVKITANLPAPAPEPEKSCEQEEKLISRAPSAEETKVAIEKFQRCLVAETSDKPSGDVKRRVQVAVMSNFYAGPKAEAKTIMDWFYNKQLLKAIPGDINSLEDYLKLAKSQKLAYIASTGVSKDKYTDLVNERIEKTNHLIELIDLAVEDEY